MYAILEQMSDEFFLCTQFKFLKVKSVSVSDITEVMAGS